MRSGFCRSRSHTSGLRFVLSPQRICALLSTPLYLGQYSFSLTSARSVIMSYNAQRVPAWKRLGLKLKGAASGESPAPASSANATPTTSAQTLQQPSPAPANVGLKRKQPPYASTPVSRAPEKRQRTEEVSSTPKKVTFTEDTKTLADKPAQEPKKAPKKLKEKKQKKVKAATEPAAPFDLEPSLVYLRQWSTDREAWKFNKNHQTLLIKYAFDTGRIPAADVPIFLSYIQDLKGFVRTRLREEAAEIKKKDMADGAGYFSHAKEKTDKDTEKAAKEKAAKESKQELYEEVLAKLLLQDGASSAFNSSGKRSFDETEFAAQEMDVDVKQRAIKRMRAELVLRELSEAEESTTTASSGASATYTSSSGEAKVAEPLKEEKKVVNPKDGAQPLKRRRLRKSRTADISDDSSSESESDSDSDNSDSSDGEEDEEMPLPNRAEAASSSSSSSSGSDDDSDSESESGAGAKVGRDRGASSDSDDSD